MFYSIPSMVFYGLDIVCKCLKLDEGLVCTICSYAKNTKGLRPWVRGSRLEEGRWARGRGLRQGRIGSKLV